MEAAVAVLGVLTIGAAVLALRAHQQAGVARAAAARLAETDPLTGLANRRLLDAELAQALRRGRRSTSRTAVIVIELQRLDVLNRTYGHEAGDALLAAAARSLATTIRRGEVLARHGGPQFVVVLPDVTDDQQVLARAEDLHHAVQRTYEIGADRIRVTACSGVVVTAPICETTADELLLDAQSALRRAADGGPGTIVEAEVGAHDRLAPPPTERRLREALEHGDFGLLWLPVVSLPDRRIVGVEALLRWSDPDTGLARPDRFLRSLEESGLIVPVGRWVVREACRQAADWATRFPDRELEVTVNLSPRQLFQSDVVETVLDAVAEHDVDPTSLCIELTEGVALRELEVAWGTLRRLKEAGLRLTLDDFGTGSASLSFLRRLRLDNLKISAELVATLADGREDEALVHQVVALAHALGMRAVAEGVESGEQAEVLAQLGCDRAQGYWFASPQPAEVIDRLLAAGVLDPTRRPAPVDTL